MIDKMFKLLLTAGLLQFTISLYAQNGDYEQGLMLYYTGRYDEALIRFKACAEREKTDFRCLYMSGKTLENLYRYDEAIEMQELASKLSPEAKEVIAALASLYMQSGQATNAASLYKRLSEKEPDKPRWIMSRALALKAALRIGDALLLFKQLETLDSLNWLVFKNSGECYLAMDSLKQASLRYENALRLYPSNIALHGQLASLYIRLNKLHEAQSIAVKSLEYDSTYIEGLRYAGIALYRQNIADAIEYFNRAMALGDSSKMVVWYSAMIMCRTFDYRRAEKMIKKALKYEPDNPHFLYYLAIALDAQGKYDESIASLDSINRVMRHYDSLIISADNQRGVTFRNMGETDKAANTFKQLAEKLPNSPLYLYNVASTYDLGGRRREAINWYKRFLNKLSPEWENEPLPELGNQPPTYKTMARLRTDALGIELFYHEKKMQTDTVNK
ncbi:MAG: tetratricopeptide repeat protein [Prevotellaceae bacterium]|jgi:tetratricopeptide (TPR) repeat protein|nr:tetratricopeptide repeat protein [Prevotellaceae bacterium]